MTTSLPWKRLGDLPARPWANGGGTTTELLSFEEGAALTPGCGQWRLSVARLEHPAPFSPLPGLWRTFLPTAATVLEIDGARVACAAGAPVSFDGAARVSLVALDAPCAAINLMADDDARDRIALDTDAAPRGRRIVAAVALDDDPGDLFSEPPAGARCAVISVRDA